MRGSTGSANAEPDRAAIGATAAAAASRSSAYALVRRNAAHMLGAQFVTALFQGLQFVLIARALGASDFGRMAGVLACTSALLPFSGVGAGNVMVMRLARQEAEPALCFGNALLVAAVSGSLLVALAAFAVPHFLRDASLLGLVLLLGTSEVLMTKFIDIAAHVFYGLDRHAYSAAFYGLLSGVRLIAAAVFCLALGQHGVMTWAVLHLAAAAAVAVVVLGVTAARIGRPRVDLGLAWRELKVGVLFSIGLSSNSVYTDIDKAVLTRSASAEISGQYTAAFRLVYMTFAPVMSVLMATQASFFRAGRLAGLPATFRLAVRVAWLGAAYCAVLAALTYFASPLVAFALGAQYALSVDVLQALSLLPMALMAQCVFSEALTGADQQRSRCLAQLAVAVLSFGANMALVPHWGWHGAVIASYASQIALGGLVVWLIWRAMRSAP